MMQAGIATGRVSQLLLLVLDNFLVPCFGIHPHCSYVAEAGIVLVCSSARKFASRGR